MTSSKLDWGHGEDQMRTYSADTIRSIDSLFNELLDLDSVTRAQRLSQLAGNDPPQARTLERLLLACVDENGIEPGGALEGDVAQEYLVGRPVMEPGEAFGPYVVGEMIGRGGMSEVYAAVRQYDGFSQNVALKIVRSDHASDVLRDRLLHEQRTLIRLEHPNIARFLDAGINKDGIAYLAMERIDGENIAEYAARTRADLRTRVRWIVDLCDALGHAHAQLIVHCDIKPSNVLIDKAGRLGLLDFGIAQILGSGERVQDGTAAPNVFTPDYAAPEQVAGLPVTTAIDVFQVGALLYRLVVGKPWICRQDKLPTPEGLVPLAPSKLLQEQSPDLRMKAHLAAIGGSVGTLSKSVQGGLDAVMLRCLASSPDDRYSSVEQLRADLSAWLDHRPLCATPPRERVRLFLRRNWRVVLPVGVSLALVLATVLIAFLKIANERDQKERERRRALAAEVFMGRVFAEASPYIGERGVDAGTIVTKVGDSLLKEGKLDTRSRVAIEAILARLEMDGDNPDRAERRVRRVLNLVEVDGEASRSDVLELRRDLGAALIRQNMLVEGIQILKDVLTLSRSLSKPVWRAQVQTMVGEAYRRLGQLEQSERYFGLAMPVLLNSDAELDHHNLEALKRYVLYLDFRGDRGEKLQAIIGRLEGGDPAQNPINHASRLLVRSYVESIVGNSVRSGEHAQEGAKVFSELLGGSHSATVKAHLMACDSFMVADLLSRARLHCEAALAGSVENPSATDDATIARMQLAIIALVRSDLVRAEEELTRTISSLGAKGDPYQRLYALLHRGVVQYRRGYYSAAFSDIESARHLQEDHFAGNKEIALNIGISLIPVLLGLDRRNEAEALFTAMEPHSLHGDLRRRFLVQRRIVELQIAAGSGDAPRTDALVDVAIQSQGRPTVQDAWIVADAAEALLRVGSRERAKSLFVRAMGMGLTPSQTPGLWSRVLLQLHRLDPDGYEQRLVREAVETCRLHVAFGSDKVCSTGGNPPAN